MLRPTGSRAPANPSTFRKSALPFGVLITPLAPSPPPRTAPTTHIPSAARESHLTATASYASDIPRCTSCAAYLSPAAILHPRTWICPLCAASNPLPSRYAPVIRAHPDALLLVPELSRDVYDVPVDAEPVTPIAYIFVLDSNGDDAYLDAAREAVHKALHVIDGQSLVAVMLYSDMLSLIDSRAGLVKRLCPLDHDLVLPLVFPPDQWLRPTGKDTTDAIMLVLSRLTANANVHNPEKHINRAMGSAVRAALDMVEAADMLAARIIVIGAGEPNFAHGAIHISDDNHMTKDRFPVPIIPFYAEQGARASTLGAMIDLYIVSRMPVDVGTISPLAHTSGGRLILYESAETTLAQDVWQHLNDPAVVRGMLRIRTSPEICVSDVYGCGVYRDVEVANVFRLCCHGHTSTLAADLHFTSEEGFSPQENRSACIQVAFRGVFLEPGILPQRVLRVETQTYGVCSSKSTLRRECDANAVTTLVFHKAIAAADDQGIGEARMLLFDWLANLVAKTATRRSDSDGEAVIDGSLERYPSLKAIPRLVFGLIRSFLFRQESVSADSRAALRCIWEDLSPELLAAAAYPRMFSFLNLEEKSIKEVALSSACVKESGHPIFLLDAFSEVVIYYGGPSRRNLTFPPPESSNVMRVRAACIRDRPVTPKCVVCREGTPKDRWFKSFLIEDAVPGAAAESFPAFMQGVVDAAQDILGKDFE